MLVLPDVQIQEGDEVRSGSPEETWTGVWRPMLPELNDHFVRFHWRSCNCGCTCHAKVGQV